MGYGSDGKKVIFAQLCYIPLSEPVAANIDPSLTMQYPKTGEISTSLDEILDTPNDADMEYVVKLILNILNACMMLIVTIHWHLSFLDKILFLFTDILCGIEHTIVAIYESYADKGEIRFLTLPTWRDYLPLPSYAQYNSHFVFLTHSVSCLIEKLQIDMNINFNSYIKNFNSYINVLFSFECIL